MTEKLATSPQTAEASPAEVDPTTVNGIDSIEQPGLIPEEDPAIASLIQARERLTATLEERDAEERADQDDAYATYAENIAASEAPTVELPVTDAAVLPETPSAEIAPGQPERVDTRSRLRKIGDAALARMEKMGEGWLVSKLESWSIIPVRGTRHKQRGMNFSAWVARRYVNAQERRKKRMEDLKDTGFLSTEASAQLNGSDITPEGGASHEASAPIETEADEARTESHDRAEAATQRKAKRQEKRPLRERATDLRERLKGSSKKLGAKALRALKRAKAGAVAAGQAWKSYGQ
jgi:hypothetical protein